MFTLLLFSQFLVPLSEPARWHTPVFDDHKQNAVSHDADGLTVRVESSSSPLFYMLPEPMNITSLSIDGFLSGLPHLGEKTEGLKDGDDFALRLGLVSSGERPGWLKRLFLPLWIKALLEIDPERGFSEVHFFNVSQTIAAGQQREHPSLRGVFEEMTLQMKTPGSFGFTKELQAPISTFALWIQSDGDDTHSTYSVKIKRILLCDKQSDKK